MLELKKGDDILTVIGGISTFTEAKDVIIKKLDETNKTKLLAIKNEDALTKIANAITICSPDSVFFSRSIVSRPVGLRAHCSVNIVMAAIAAIVCIQ